MDKSLNYEASKLYAAQGDGSVTKVWNGKSVFKAKYHKLKPLVVKLATLSILGCGLDM